MTDRPSLSILITGTSSGFGRLTARTLLDEGHTVFATMRDVDGRNREAADGLRGHAKASPGTVHLLELDVTDPASVEAAVAAAHRIARPLDVVVNNAGAGVGGLAEAFTAEQLAGLLDVNVVGVHRINRAVLPAMREAGRGLLVHLSSLMGRVVIPFSGPYTASKFALEGLVESLRYELASTGVDVVLVEPGGFATDFGQNMISPADEERSASYGAVAKLPEQMWGGIMEQLENDGPDPQLVADAIRDLIHQSPGQRPLRTVIDPLFGGEGAKAVNATTDQVQKELLDQFGIGHLRSVGG